MEAPCMSAIIDQVLGAHLIHRVGINYAVTVFNVCV